MKARLPARLKATALVLALVLGLGLPAGAATYVVAPAGLDSNPGTLAQPFRTINRAVIAVAPGDVVQVRNGVYTENVNLWAEGTPAARIRFEAFPGEIPVLDGTGTASNTTLVTISGNWIDFKGFEIRNARRTGLTIWEASQVRLLSNIVHHSWLGGIFVGGSGFGLTASNLVQGNQVYQNCQMNAPHTLNGGWPAAIGSEFTEHLQIVGNTIHENHGEGAAFTLANDGIALGNTVHDNFSVNLYLDNARFCTLEGNFILSTGNTNFHRSGKPANGISMANETYGASNPLNGNVVVNNILLGGRRCIYYGNYQSGGGLKNTLIAHNTCFNAVDAVLGIETDTGHAGTVVANNVFQQTVPGAALATVVTNGISYHHNSWAGGSAGAAAGIGDVAGDPLLANPGGTVDTDYQLQAGSPCFEAGAELATVALDYWGIPRTTRSDIGAHERSSAPSAGPAAPTGLAATAVSSTQVNLTWVDASGDETGFVVERSTNNVAFNQVASLGANVTAWSDTTTVASRTYYYRVRAVNAGGSSAWSNTATVTTPGAVPAPPAALTATALAKRKIRLNWTDSSNNESGFKIERSTNGTTWTQIATAAANATTYTNSGLSSGTTYYYRVRAYNAAGDSAYSNTASATASN